ncbi:lipase 2 [Fusarium coicis]|nr:lipase 2 [Fusarium coicis]
MVFPDPELETYVFRTAPPLDTVWLAHEEEAKKKSPPRVFSSVEERQPIYAQECRDLYAQVTAPGTRDHELSQGVTKQEFTIPSSVDGHPIPVLQLDLTGTEAEEPEVIVIFYHGGGLRVGEADSEELSCRHIVKSGIARIRLYSVGYRLLPQNPATIRTIVIGSSSGGQMASAVAQAAPQGTIHGLLLRCPVTADRASGEEFVPEKLRPYHTSVSGTFITSLGGYLQRNKPRDGLEKLPLEVSKDELKGHPRTWIQLTSNDPLYSDGLCYAMILREAGIDVKVQVEVGWPHTFWLKAPHLDHALTCEKHMLDGLRWLLK